MSKRVAPSLGCGYFLVAVLGLAGGLCFFFAARHLAGGAARGLPSEFWPPAIGGALLWLAAGAYARFARKAVREHAEDERRRAAHPDEPWKWRREWLGDRLESEDRRGLALLWFFVLVWNGISTPALVGILANPPRDKAAYFVFLFPLVGLGLLWTAIHQTIRARKYGRVRFAPASLPGVLGGHLGGVIEVPARVNALGNLRLVLRCIRKTITGSGKSRRVRETTLWETAESVPPERWFTGPGRTEIPVLFTLPRDQPATDLDDGDNQVIWRLVAEAETPGVDFAATFHPPVFAVPGQEILPPAADHESDGTAPGASAGAGWRPPGAPAPRLDDAFLRRVGVVRLADGWRFDGRPLRAAKWITTGLLLFLLGVLVTLIVERASFVPILFVGVFTLIAWLIAHSIYFGNTEVRREGGELVVRDWEWCRRRESRVPLADLADVRIANSMSIGATQYHRLILVGRPVGETDAPPHPREPFATRKLRFKLQRDAGAESASLRRQLAAASRFELVCARHIPERSTAESVREELINQLIRSR